MAAGFYDLLVVQGVWLGGKVRRPAVTETKTPSTGGDGGKVVRHRRDKVDGGEFADLDQLADVLPDPRLDEDEVIAIILAELDDWF